MKSTLKWAVTTLLVPLALAGVLWAQVDKATINGSVKDPSDAVIPGVKVTAANVETGVSYSGTTNEVGMYQIHALPIGRYVLRYEKSGFKTVERPGLTLEVGQIAEINIKLQVGSTSEMITVESTPVLLNTESSTLGTVMSGTSMQDLPLNISGGRDITNFIYTNVATTQGGNWVGHVGGSQNMSKNVLVDGTDATSGLQGFVQNVGMEAVQEMNVQISGITAEGAATGGGTVLMELKSGTNQFHGSGFYYLENEALDANSWDNNFFQSQCASGDAGCRKYYGRPRDRFNDWGFSAGGPIWKNKTFIFGAWERYRNVTLSFAPNQSTVPTNAFLNGDFSALLGGPVMVTDPANPNGPAIPAVDPCTGQQILTGQIYDPSAQYVNALGVTCHVPFAGNIIPSNRISPIAQSMINKLYKNGYAPTNGGLTNNFPMFTGNAGQTTEHFDMKVDHNLNDKQRLAFSYNWWTLPYTGSGGLWQSGSSTAGPLSTGLTQTQWDRSFRVQHFYNISPTLLNAFSAVYNEHKAVDSAPGSYDAADVGISGTNGKNFPVINFYGGIGGTSETSIGSPYGDHYVMYNRSISDTLSWARGRHSIKFGGDFQARGMNSVYDNGMRTYNFNNSTGAPTDPEIQPYVGFAFANFLLGDVQDASQSVGYSLHGRRKHMSLFATDDIKVTPKFTLSAGLRWDFNFRFHEADGKWANFDLAADNPAWGSYDGAWKWANGGGDSFEKNQNYTEFGPHIGAAYQIRDKLVARGGYGLFYTPLALNQWSGVPFAWMNGALGFIGSNVVVNTIPDKVGFQWDAGYPGQNVYPARTPDQTYVAGGAAYIWPNSLTMGRTQNFNLGLEYEVMKNAVVSVNYMANYGSHLHDPSTWANNYPTQAQYLQLLNSGHVNDVIYNATDAANAGVPYPYPGFFGFAFQAIAPYPQLASQGAIVIPVNPDLGVSHYRALITEMRIKGAHGITMDLNYTWSRSQGNASDGGNYAEGWSALWAQDPYNLKNLTDQVNDWDHTHELKGYVVYELPFGKGKRWGNTTSALNHLIGGWSIGTELNYHSGEPMWMVSAGFNYPGWDGVFANWNHSLTGNNLFKGLDLTNLADPNSLFFNPAAFSKPAFGSFSPEKYSITDKLRTWAYYGEDISLMKKLRFGSDGHYVATLRAQFFDAFNRHYWGAPNTDINSPYFGHVTSVSGRRTGQIGARFEW